MITLFIAIRISRVNSKMAVTNILNGFYEQTNDMERAREMAEHIICVSENSQIGDVFYISPIKRKWVNEWLDEHLNSNTDNKHITAESLRIMPKELNNDKAKKLFNKIEELGHCEKDGDIYKWVASASLFGYFVDKASDILNVRPSNNNIPWRVFKQAFQMNETNVRTAKQAVNGYNNKCKNEPEGALDIKKAISYLGLKRCK